MEKVFVVARLQAKEGRERELANELQQIVPLVREEVGCLRYDLHQGKDAAGSFMFYEVWSDDAALEAHAQAPHMLAMRERIKDLVTSPSDISLWRGLNADEA